MYESQICNLLQLWDPAVDGPFNFLYTYAASRYHNNWACTRRIWRIFTLAAPSLLPAFSPFTDQLSAIGFGADFKSPYPFR
jgi:dipeptidase